MSVKIEVVCMYTGYVVRPKITQKGKVDIRVVIFMELMLFCSKYYYYYCYYRYIYTLSEKENKGVPARVNLADFC
jgi:hypothetical protein